MKTPSYRVPQGTSYSVVSTHRNKTHIEQGIVRECILFEDRDLIGVDTVLGLMTFRNGNTVYQFKVADVKVIY